jgi:hypothetical protein
MTMARAIIESRWEKLTKAKTNAINAVDIDIITKLAAKFPDSNVNLPLTNRIVRRENPASKTATSGERCCIFSFSIFLL